MPQAGVLDCELNDMFLTVDEVKEIIKGLDQRKATGRLLIAAVGVIVEPLTQLFNKGSTIDPSL